MVIDDVIHPIFIVILFGVSICRWVYLTFCNPPITAYLDKKYLNLPALVVRIYVFLFYLAVSIFDIDFDIGRLFVRFAFLAWGVEEVAAFIVMLAFQAGYNHKLKDET